MALLFSVALPVHAVGYRRVYFYQTDTFKVASNAAIVVGSNYKASLYNVKVGDLVRVGYDRENGALMVHEIGDGVRHKAPKASTTNTSASSSGQAHPHRSGEPLLHINGIVRGVDPSGGTVTLAHARR